LHEQVADNREQGLRRGRQSQLAALPLIELHLQFVAQNLELAMNRRRAQMQARGCFDNAAGLRQRQQAPQLANLHIHFS